MTMNPGRSKLRAAEINVTPLVDVVLVLLIIFMVATPVVLREIAAAVPRTQTGAAPPPGPLLVGQRNGAGRQGAGRDRARAQPGRSLRHRRRCSLRGRRTPDGRRPRRRCQDA